MINRKNFPLNKEKSLKEKSRKISIYEGSAYSLMDGFGIRYIAPFANNFLMSKPIYIGLLSSIPGLFSTFCEIVSLKFIEIFPRKKLAIIGALLQAIMWIPIILLAVYFVDTEENRIFFPILLIILYTMLVSFGAFGRPPWNSWMRDIINKKTDSYFGKRNSITSAIALICFFISAFILDNIGKTFIGFSIIFGIAFLGRVSSALFLSKQYEPKLKLKKGYYFSYKDFLKEMPHRNFGNYVLFSAAITFAVSIASPYFIVYMGKNFINFNYIFYMIIVFMSSIVSLMFMPFWGKVGDRFGNVKVMKLCGSLIFIVPLLWFFSSILFDNTSIYLFIFLIFSEIISGFIWSGLNLSSSTFVYHAVSRERMALCVAYENITTSVFAFFGAMLGGWIASQNYNILGLKPILFVFILSSILRILFFHIFINRFKEVRKVDKNFNMKKFIYSIPGQSIIGMGIKRLGHPLH